MICWRVGRRAGADALSFRTSCSSVGRVRGEEEGRGGSQTCWGRLQWIAPASANKVQRLGPRPEKTTFGTLYQVLMTGLKLWLIYPFLLSVILAMIANFFHQMHLCLYFILLCIAFIVHKHHHPSIPDAILSYRLSTIVERDVCFYCRRWGVLTRKIFTLYTPVYAKSLFSALISLHLHCLIR